MAERAGRTVVATANVLDSLPRQAAGDALRDLLSLRPDLVGLQEWGPSRRRLLRQVGRGYRWVGVLGGNPVGARADRYDLLGWRLRSLGPPVRADPGTRPLGLLPPRLATVATFRDRRQGRVVCVVDFHLVPGVQAGGRLREDRPRAVARHHRERRALERLVAEQLALGHVVHAVGDSNLDGLRLPGLTSAWEGREHEPGTLGPRRKVDDVHGPGPAVDVRLLTNASDHRAVVVTRSDRP